MTAKTVNSLEVPSRPHVGSRIWRWIALWAILVVAAIAMRVPFLTAAGRFLVVDDKSISAPTHVLMLDAQDVDVVAAEMFHARPTIHLLAVERVPGRAMQLGVLPLYEDYMRDRLQQLGVPSDQLVVLKPAAVGQTQIAQRVAEWLRGHPEATVLALCEPFRGRSWQNAFRRAIPESERRRIAIRAVRSPHYDETSWHKDKVGSAILLKEYLTLLYGTDRPE